MRASNLGKSCLRLRAISFLCLSILATISSAQQDYVYEKAPFNYWSADIVSPVTKLGEKLASGEVVLPLKDEKETLREILKQWNVPVESQVLVFSKTSFQRDRITPSTPRAIYFNEQTYVGIVPGGLLEIAQMDSKLGPIFYTFDRNRPDRKFPRFDRDEACMNCHSGGMTDYLPGLLVRSVFPNDRGEPLFQAGTSLVDQQTPLENRWGGWYVTGKFGSANHRGNATAEMVDGKAVVKPFDPAAENFPKDRYLAPSSDVLALLVLDHQIGMHQRLTKASYDVTLALKRRIELLQDLGEEPGNGLSASALSVATSHVDKVLEFLFFCKEAPLPEGGIEGLTAYAEGFQKNRKSTKDGRSLKDLQLLNRLLKYRCSYFIYSQEWDNLPPPFLEMLYKRMHEILTSKEPVKGYEHLVDSERKAIVEILKETKEGLPADWK